MSHSKGKRRLAPTSLCFSPILFSLIFGLGFAPLMITARTSRDKKSLVIKREAANKEPNFLEIGSASVLRHQAIARAPAEIKIVSYNIRWRGGDDLRQLITLLKDDKEIGGAAIIGLQEVDRNKKRTGNVNTAREMAEALGMHYAWAAPPPPPSDDQQEEETGVALLSSFPVTDVERIVLPHAGPGGRHRAAIGATIHLGVNRVRIYSVHAETRIPVEKKMDQLSAVLDDLRRRPKTERAVVLGDFNTIKEKDVNGAIKMFSSEGFTTPIPHNRSTWKTFIFKLKLDWMWLRDLQPIDSGITRHVGLSDHWPLWVRVKLEENEKPPVPSPSTKTVR